MVAALERLRRKPRDDARVPAMLSSLVERSLEIGDGEGAARWFAELETTTGGRVLPQVRFGFLRQRGECGDHAALAQQAGLLFGDPSVTVQSAGAAVRETLRILYEELSPAACDHAIGMAHADLASDPVLRAARSLCRCPRTFRAPDEARHWQSKLPAKSLDFSSGMRRDARLVAVRAAAAEDDVALAGRLAEEAWRDDPVDLDAMYWVIRTRLASGVPAPLEGTPSGSRPATPAWRRLRAALDLQARPGPKEAERVLAEVRAEPEGLDPSERQLLRRLLQPPLTAQPSQTPEELSRLASLCEEVERDLGPTPWTGRTIALKELVVDRAYDEALRRAPPVSGDDDEETQELSRIARILAASPSPTKKDDRVRGATERLEQAVHLLLRAEAPDRARMATLYRHLAGTAPASDLGRLPALRATRATVVLALGFLIGETSIRASLRDIRWSSDAPAWCTWLLVRVALATGAESVVHAILEKVDVKQPGVGWTIDSWAADHVLRRPVPGEVLRNARAGYAAALSRMPGRVQEFAASLISVRKEGAREAEPVLEVPGRMRSFGRLGGMADALFVADMDLERRYAIARKRLASGETAVAVRLFRRLELRLGPMNGILCARWAPVVRYWLGVALAHARDPRAADVLRAARSGPTAQKARAQLALLALREGDNDKAADELDSVPASFPASFFAHALLLERRGANAQARNMLASFPVAFPTGAFPYASACRSLAGAMAERQGDGATAERLHRRVLEVEPENAPSAARLARILLRRALEDLEGARKSYRDDLQGLAARTDGIAKHAPWYREIAELIWALIRPVDELVDFAGDSKLGGGARQLALGRLIAAGRLDEAQKAAGGTGSCSAVGERTRLILRARDLLASAWNAKPKRLAADLRARLEEMDAHPELHENAEFRRWHALLRCADEVLREKRVSPDAWKDVEPWDEAVLPALLCGDGAARKAAAERLAAPATMDGRWNPRQRHVVDALVAHAKGDREGFLTRCEKMQQSAEHPLDRTELWLACARVRAHRREWERLAEDESAPHEDERVREIVGFANAKAAGACASKDPRRALDLVRRARRMLGRQPERKEMR